ncbi:MAG: conjugal transfer ATP-binding protein TraC [Candidatus Paceibacteria bacterium]|jgi:conjugal transfer ATP-binding protein TraC
MGFFDKLTNKKSDTGAKAMPVLPEEIYRTATLELQDVIAPAALKIQPKLLHLGDKVARTYFVVSYPRYLTDNWFTPIINLDKIFDISVHIHPIDTSSILKKFEKKVAEVQSQIESRSEKGVVRDPILDTAYRDLEDLRDSLQQAQEKMFEVGLYVTIYGDTEKELAEIETKMKSILESKLVYLKPALFQQKEGFLSSIPVGDDQLAIHQKMNSAPLSSIFPFVSFDLTKEDGILYGINRQNSSLVIFDRFSMPNYNSITFATSGAGKSFATKLEILRSLMFDTSVIVIDPEKEYEALAEAVGGRFFNISLSSEHHINPFDLPKPAEDETLSDVLRTTTINLVGLFRIMLGGLTPEEDAIVDGAITQTYALKDITDETDFSEKEPPLLSDFEMVLQGMDGTESVLQRLSKFTTGSWSTFMNRPTNVDINKKFIVFSVRDMEDDLKPVAMYLVTQFIWSAIRKEIKKRILVVDEAWWMMKSEDTASFLYAIAKRGRKYYLGLSTITQDVGDFMRSKYGVPIVTNSSIQLLLKQSPSTIDVLQKTFNLTDEEKYLLLEANVGEGIFFAGLKHVAIKIIASYTEEQIITSDPAQILAIQRAKTDKRDSDAAAEKKNREKIDDVVQEQVKIQKEQTLKDAKKVKEEILEAQKDISEPEDTTPNPEVDSLSDMANMLDGEISTLEDELGGF